MHEIFSVVVYNFREKLRKTAYVFIGYARLLSEI